MSDEIYKIINDYNKEKSSNMRAEGREVFENLKEDLGFNIIKEYNNIINFEYNNQEFFYVEKNKKIRRKGSKTYYPIKGFDFDKGYTENTLTFGKYKGEFIEDVAKKDYQYLQWMVNLDTIHPSLKTDIEKVLSEISQVEDNRESYKLKYAKELFFEWIKTPEENENFYNKVGDLEWRPNYGEFMNLPFYSTSSKYYFETSEGLKEDFEDSDLPDNCFQENYDRGSLLFTPHITIFHKGIAVYMIDIVDNNPTPYNKILKVKEFGDKEGYTFNFYQIEADYILSFKEGDRPLKLNKKILLGN